MDTCKYNQILTANKISMAMDKTIDRLVIVEV